MCLVDPFANSDFCAGLLRSALSAAMRERCLATELVDDAVMIDCLVIYTDGSAVCQHSPLARGDGVSTSASRLLPSPTMPGRSLKPW